MANESQRAQLPGYDTAPDVYETPDFEDDSTQSTVRSSLHHDSDQSVTSEEDDEEDEDGDCIRVSHRRLHPARARNLFGDQSRNVETRGADLSDRVDGRRRGYRARRGIGGSQEEETLEARLARLRREVEECRAEAEGNAAGDEDLGKEAEALSLLIAGIDLGSRPQRIVEAGQQVANTKTSPLKAATPSGDGESQSLGKISAFDARLAALETVLGISSLHDQAIASTTQADPPPLLPTLTLLDAQLASLTSATSLTALESAATKLFALKASRQVVSSDASGEEEVDSPEHETLQSLYTLLPALQSLTPTVPALVSRLRSLRTLHAAAASASEELERLEQQQTRLDGELKAWRTGLEKVEEAVEAAAESNMRNAKTVKGWVADLEKRVKGPATGAGS